MVGCGNNHCIEFLFLLKHPPPVAKFLRARIFTSSPIQIPSIHVTKRHHLNFRELPDLPQVPSALPTHTHMRGSQFLRRRRLAGTGDDVAGNEDGR